MRRNSIRRRRPPTNQQIGLILMAQLDALNTAVDALTAEVAIAVEQLTAPAPSSTPTQAEVDAVTEKVTSAVSQLQAAVTPPAEAPEPPSLG